MNQGALLRRLEYLWIGSAAATILCLAIALGAAVAWVMKTADPMAAEIKIREQRLKDLEAQMAAAVPSPAMAATVPGPAAVSPLAGPENKPKAMAIIIASFYRNGDSAEALFDGEWLPVTVNQVEDSNIRVDRLDGQKVVKPKRVFEVRIAQEVAAERIRASAEAAAAREAAEKTKPKSKLASLSAKQVPLMLEDCRPGLRAMVRLKPQENVYTAATVARVEGDLIYVRTNNKAVPMALGLGEMSTIGWSQKSKEPMDYRIGERVFVKWVPDSLSWSLNRVDRVEGDQIFVRWNRFGEDSPVKVSLTKDVVRPMSMDESRGE